MNPFKRAVLWTALIAIVLLACLSVYGAFIGDERAQAFFNSLPLAVYWFVLVALLVVGIALFRRLLRVPSLLLMHLGSIFVLVGAMWGSNAGHTIQKQLLGIDKTPGGQMGIYERMEENRVTVEGSRETPELPFFVRLQDFRMEYYKGGYLIVRNQDGQMWKQRAEQGAELSLGEDLGKVAIRRVFENFKIDIKGDEPVAYDEPGGSNPALEVTIERPGAAPGRRYVFERMSGHMDPNSPLVMSYTRIVSDYISELEIVKDGKVVAAKDIEVNHPLYYGGYHFYQHWHGEDKFGEYTLLMVVSDSGLNLVYGGFMLLVAGVFWHFWGRRVLSAIKNRRMVVPEAKWRPRNNA